uniref:Selenoprotein M n=1 Tax=Geotrypetes seraphini TaxID=260995 RepID=A0A6P8S3R4_GEOSA|nr:selenoprotein M [Geotrypetes seraphini]
MWFLLLLGLFQPLLAYDINWKKLEGLTKCKVEVKAFITEDLPLFHNLEIVYVGGADPELICFNAKYKELERIPLKEMKRDKINQLVKDLGFYKKEKAGDPVPPEFLHAPAKVAPAGATKDTAHVEKEKQDL